jgi:hypothetical protein
MAAGECSWASVRQITREPDNCVLSVELARDTSTCTSLVQRGTPLNTARCTTPKASGSIASAEWHPVIDMNSRPAMAASLFTLIVVPAYYEMLGQSRSSPGNDMDMALAIPSFLTLGNAPEVADFQ